MDRIRQPARCGGKSRLRLVSYQAPSGRCHEWRANMVFDRVQPAALTILRKETDRAPAGVFRRVPSHVATKPGRSAGITRNAGKGSEILPGLTVIFYRVGVGPAWRTKLRCLIRRDFR